MQIKGFRNLNHNVETIINKSEAVKKAKKEGEDKLTEKQKKELSEAEKDYKSKRKQIQEKLIKFATRVPVFMYLTDYRERCLKDVITQLEPGLFKKVTGLNVKDFELLCSIGVFNANLMNDAIFKFKRYEDASLSYTGINRHKYDEVGGWDTAIRREEYEKLFYNQQATMAASQNGDISEEKIIIEKPQPALKPVTTAKPSLLTSQYGIKSPVEEQPKVEKIKEPDPKMDLSAVKIDAIVKHKIFGEGVIVKLNDKHIYVEFKAGQKNFIFPDAFMQGFLKM